MPAHIPQMPRFTLYVPKSPGDQRPSTSLITFTKYGAWRNTAHGNKSPDPRSQGRILHSGSNVGNDPLSTLISPELKTKLPTKEPAADQNKISQWYILGQSTQ
jgi:hypothetical protein